MECETITFVVELDDYRAGNRLIVARNRTKLARWCKAIPVLWLVFVWGMTCYVLLVTAETGIWDSEEAVRMCGWASLGLVACLAMWRAMGAFIDRANRNDTFGFQRRFYSIVDVFKHPIVIHFGRDWVAVWSTPRTVWLGKTVGLIWDDDYIVFTRNWCVDLPIATRSFESPEQRQRFLDAARAGNWGVPEGRCVCRDCGKMLTLEATVRFGDEDVCPSCKPEHVARIRENVDRE